MDDNNWFHGDISTRTEAEKVLTDYGFEEGLFLVRISSSSNCDFVLSVVHSNSIIHYQIRRHLLDRDEKAEEALFSLSVVSRGFIILLACPASLRCELRKATSLRQHHA